MLIKLGLRNFKAFGEYTEIKLTDLSLFSGLNSSGKSTIYQILLLLSQSDGLYYFDCKGNRLPYLNLNGEKVSLGRSEEVLHDKTKDYLEFSFFWDTEMVHLRYNISKTPNTIGYNSDFENTFYLSQLLYCTDREPYEVKLNIFIEDNQWTVTALNTLRFSNYEFNEIIVKKALQHLNNIGKASIDDLYSDFVEFKGVDCVDLVNIRLNSFALPLKKINSIYSDEYKKHISAELLEEWVSGTEHFSENYELVNTTRCDFVSNSFFKDKITHIPPFRGMPKRIYTQNTNPLQSLERSSGINVAYDYDLNENRVLRKPLGDALKFWVVDSFELADDVIVSEGLSGLVSEIFLVTNGVKVPINNVGFGVSQILPVIFELLKSSSDKFVIVDEPEIHLHPSIQSKLATFFVKMALAGKNIILETHSEYLIDKILYHKIKHPNISEKIRLYWVKTKQNESYVDKIESDDLGYIINAPDGFLNEKQKLVEEITAIRMEKLEDE